MMRNLLLLSLLIAAVQGATIDSKAVKPTRKSTHEIRKVIKSALHDAPKKTTAAAVAVAAAKIRSGELKPNVDAHAAADNKQAAGAAVAAPLSLRGAVKVAAEEVKIHNKAKLFSPNKGFIEITDYGTDWNCYYAPKSISGSAVNSCYFDPEMGAAAEVATLTKMPNNGNYYFYEEYISSTSLVYDDPHCTMLNVNATSVNGPYPRNRCYYEVNATTNSITGKNIKMDHVFTPTFVQNAQTVMFLEYANEGGCSSNDPNALISYGSVDIPSFACEAYVNVDEYFKLSCDAGVVKAQVYSDAACATPAIRADDASNGCNDLDAAYPYRMTCGVPP